MKKNRLIFLLLILTINSCKKDNSNPVNSASNNIEIAKSTVVADSVTINNFIGNDSTSLTFNSNVEQIKNLNIGSILVINKGEGYLRKVKAIQQENGTTKIITENARLDEVIVKGEFEKEIIIEPNNLLRYQFSDNKILLEKTNDQFSILFNKVVVGISSGTTIYMDGQTQFSPPVLKIKPCYENGLDSLTVSVEMNAFTKYVLDADGSLTGGYKITPVWGEFTFAPITVLVAFVPVLITPKIKLVFGANAAIDGKININFDADTKIIAGITYKKNILDSYVFSSVEQTYNNQNMGTLAKGSIEGYILLPKVGFYIYSLAGPFIDLKFYGSLRGKDAISSGLYFGLSGEGGIETDILGIFDFPNAQWKATIFNVEKEIKVSSYPVNKPPNIPTIEYPLNNSTDILTDSPLKWSCTDPDGDPLRFDVYFGTASNPSLVKSNQTDLTYNPGLLNNNKKYYWKIVANDNHGGTTAGPIWNFTTVVGTLPNIPILSSPSNGSSGQSTSPTLSWKASSAATGYSLQVSTSNSFSSFVYNKSGLTSTSQQVSGLNNSTTYYWRVNASNNLGTSSWSSVWNFITENFYLNVNTNSLSVRSSANSQDSFNISSNTSWNISDDADWLKVSPTSGSGNGAVTVTATSVNTTTSSRSATVTIIGSGVSSRTVTVTQSGMSYPCYPNLPNPSLRYTGSEDYSTDSGDFTRYNLTVDNFSSFPNELFNEAPDLPPCGLNDNSSRSWVEIYDNNNNYLYSNCGLPSSSDLQGLWFGLPKGQNPPSAVYIIILDRRCNIEYQSNSVSIH